MCNRIYPPFLIEANVCLSDEFLITRDAQLGLLCTSKFKKWFIKWEKKLILVIL